MSEGKFKRSRYEDNEGGIHPIRIQPETELFNTTGGFNTAPTGAIDDKVPAKVSAGAREFALSPRYVVLAFKENPPDGYLLDSPIKLPILRKAFFDTLQPEQAANYLDTPCEIIGKRGERPE